MLAPNDVKEELSLAYVHAVASRAGFSVEETRKDRDSIDLKVRAQGSLVEDAVLTSPELSIQLKATVIDPLPDGEFTFPLPRKNYDDLIRKTLVPRILVVFVLPREQSLWLNLDEEALVLRRCAYWTSLLGWPPTDVETKKTVTLARSRQFDPASLRTLLEAVAREEEIKS